MTLAKPGQGGSLDQILTLIVSVSTMKEHCSVFQSLNLGNPIMCDRLLGHEVFLRTLHDRMDREEDWDRGIWTIGIEDVKDVLEACNNWGAEPKVLRYFVSFWLAAKDPSELSPGELNDRFRLCDIVGGLETQKQCLSVALGQLRSNILSSKVWRFPPVLAPTDKQSGILVFDGKLARWDYGTIGFSPRFAALYGRPTKYYSDFYRFMRTEFDDAIAPRYNKFSFKRLIEEQNFVHFIKAVQNTAKLLGRPVLTKAEVEAGWVKCLMNHFDRNYSDKQLRADIFENAKEALSIGISQVCSHPQLNLATLLTIQARRILDFNFDIQNEAAKSD